MFQSGLPLFTVRRVSVRSVSRCNVSCLRQVYLSSQCILGESGCSLGTVMFETGLFLVRLYMFQSGLSLVTLYLFLSGLSLVVHVVYLL